MGQTWTDQMQAELERWQVSANVPAPVSSVQIDADLRYRDVVLGALAHLLGLVRYRVLRGAPPVWSLAQEIDYAAFLRRLGEPLDREIEALIDADLDIFEGVKCYRA